MRDRNDPVIRNGALLLSSLALTPDHALAAFREQRVADRQLDLEHLKMARVILDAVGFALRSRDTRDWRRVERAFAELRQIGVPAEALDRTPRRSYAIQGSAAPPVDIEQYAMIVVYTELASPEQRVAIHAQYDIDGEAGRRRLDEHYGRRLRDEPHLRQWFDGELSRWRAWTKS